MGASPHLPSGTVTFLFTDVEGSTRRAVELGDEAWAELRETQRRLLRRIFSAHRGVEVDSVGDAFFVVFERATDAATAAIEGQQALEEHPWPDGKRIRVRMGLHTGEAIVREGGYVGHHVHRASRICDAAHGGQILVSEATAALVGDALPEGATLMDLGRHRLKDLHEPQRLLGLQGPGLSCDFPSLRTLDAVPNNLPVQRSTFIGREGEIPRIRELLKSHSLVTLIGVGGAGKTRLALQVGAEELDRFPDGVFFVDLSSLTDGAAVASAVAEAFGMPMARGPVGTTTRGSAEDEIVAFLKNRRVLLIIDNCEHLLEDCAVLVDRVLAAASGLVVLATSREALAVEGEQSWQVRSLALPDGDAAEDAEAIRLLVDRIRSVRPGFEVGPENRDSLVEICVRLDGIPLALELAAARAAHLAPADIARRLEDRFKLLAGGRRRAQRQQTLRATVDWSYELLVAEEQSVFRRLAVFSGGFTLEAVEGVCMDGIGKPAIDLLGSLVDKSLVVADTVEGRTRHRLLETIRLYAEEKLVGAGEAERTRSAHRDWFLQRLEEEPWDRCFFSELLARELNREYDNLRTALEWCRAEDRSDLLRRLLLRSASVFFRFGRFAEARRWFDLVLEYERSHPREERFAHVLVEWLGAWRFKGDPAETEESLRHLETLSRGLSDGGPAAALASGVRLALLPVFPGRAVEMERSAELASESAAAAYPFIQTWSLWFKAIAFLYQRRYAEADRLLERLRESLDRVSGEEAGYVETALAVVRHLDGNHREALRVLEGAPHYTWDTEELNREIITAVATAALGDVGGARSRLRKAVTSIREAGWEYPLARSDCLVGLAGLAALEGDAKQASRLIAGIPNMATGTPQLWVLLRHYRDRVREQLDPETRRQCVEEGRATSVDQLIDHELARWSAEETTPSPT